MQARAALHARLQSRRSEIEQATLTRVHSISDPTDVADPAYAEGLRSAVSVALDHGLGAIESSANNLSPVPPALLAQARLASRGGVSLDTVLRRYFAGYAILNDFLIEEWGGHLDEVELKLVLRSQATHFDRLLAAISEEYGREAELRLGTTEQRHTERVRRLLAGEQLDIADFAYEFDAHHLGLIATGRDAARALRHFGDSLDRRLLLVQAEAQTAWAWIGGRNPLDLAEIEALLSSSPYEQVAIVLGEPADGLPGWRLTHRQAAAALLVAQRGSGPVVRYADVALLASILQDDLLATSLRALYLAPLARQRDGGQVFRETLRAYLAAGRNVSSAAAALGVNRHTVARRLRAIEKRIGHPLDSFAADIEAALRLDELGDPPLTDTPSSRF